MKEAKRQHSARFKNTEQKTPQRKKQQCFRAESEPDVHILKAEGKVCAPLDSFVGHVKTARAPSGGCFPPMKDKTVPFNAGGTTWSFPTRPAKKTHFVQIKFSAAADGFAGCGAVIESSRFREYVVICRRFEVAKDARQGGATKNPCRIETVGRVDLSKQEESLE